MKSILDNLAKAVKQNCSPPFLPEGLVHVQFQKYDDGERVLNIQIGSRDFSLDERLNCTGSGSRCDD